MARNRPSPPDLATMTTEVWRGHVAGRGVVICCLGPDEPAGSRRAAAWRGAGERAFLGLVQPDTLLDGDPSVST